MMMSLIISLLMRGLCKFWKIKIENCTKKITKNSNKYKYKNNKNLSGILILVLKRVLIFKIKGKNKI